MRSRPCGRGELRPLGVDRTEASTAVHEIPSARVPYTHPRARERFDGNAKFRDMFWSRLATTCNISNVFESFDEAVVERNDQRR